MPVDEMQSGARGSYGPVTNGPVDIIMLTHNRLEHLVATVDALEERTPEPYRLTIVDNASGPEVRNWLAANSHRFERVIYNSANEHVPGFMHGIRATLSDPFVLTDPDVIVPAVEPSWLARMFDLVERYPDFGLIGIGCDLSNRPAPPILEPEVIDPAKVVNDEIVETGVGTIFQFIRRDALVTEYRSDGQACTAIRRAGYRVGWSHQIRGLHLGWDDFRLYPGHLLSKRSGGVGYPESYGEVDLIRRPPTLAELAQAGPVVAHLRDRGVPDASILELAWDGPVVGPSVPGVISLAEPAADELSLQDGAAGAVVLKLPPAERAEALLREAFRLATGAVVALAPLATFAGRTATDLAPEGWTGHEAAAIADVPRALASAVHGDDTLQKAIEGTTANDREQWLELFARGTFGNGSLRLWVWERSAPASPPERVNYDPELIQPWRADTMSRNAVKQRGRLERLWLRADLKDRVTVVRGRLRKKLASR